MAGWGGVRQNKACARDMGLILCLVLSCLVLSCLVLSCLVLPCLVLPCLVLSCLALSCLVYGSISGSLCLVSYFWLLLLVAPMSLSSPFSVCLDEQRCRKLYGT
jgi:hypothetical protein